MESYMIAPQYLTTLPGGTAAALSILPEYDRPEDHFSYGEDDGDMETCREIRSQVERGNTWAWCVVRLDVSDNDATGTAYLGCVSYWWTPETPNDSAIVSAFMGDLGQDLLADAIVAFFADRARLIGKYRTIA